MLKIKFSVLIVILLVAIYSHAQQIALVDVAYILENMETYKKAQQDLDDIAQEWQQQIAMEHDKIKSMYNKYQAELVLLSEDMKKQKEEEIMSKEREVRELQRAKFGPEGELFQKRQTLVAPLQEKVYSVIQDYANERGYDIIIDKGGSSGVLFSSERYDKTEDILQRLKTN